MNAQTRMSAKGQIVIPKSVRDRLHWLPGTDLEIVEEGDCVTLRPRAASNPRITHQAFRDAVPLYRGPPGDEESWKKAVDTMIADEWAKKG